uniref:Uncharacterized protein n=1 Tax=Haptolina brevifila TaxID=156173 RepID=A0A7S2DIZ7_9EUKA|mmetsp:Transcript_39345/g.78638  ORF Transcript_39345/g.78638 Transcript_39345/m.78638 type:complete len:148 (+) Transcript_39345:128-571(+)
MCLTLTALVGRRKTIKKKFDPGHLIAHKYLPHAREQLARRSRPLGHLAGSEPPRRSARLDSSTRFRLAASSSPGTALCPAARSACSTSPPTPAATPPRTPRLLSKSPAPTPLPPTSPSPMVESIPVAAATPSAVVTANGMALVRGVA